MFNQDQKERYIEDYKDRNTALEKDMSIKFGNSESYETSLNKDICNFTTSEILTYYKTILTSSLEYLMVLNNDFKKYTDWCMANSLVTDCQNHYSEITNDVLMRCVHTSLSKEKLISREELKKHMRTMQNKSDALLILAYFEGICGKDNCDLFNLHPDQIQNGELHLSSGKIIPCSEELKRMMIESANEYEYYEVSDGSGKRRGSYDLNDSRCFKSMYNTADVARPRTYGQRIRVKLDRIRKYTGCEAMIGKALRESGRIDYIVSIADESDSKDLKGFIKNNYDAICEVYGQIPSIPRYLLKYEEFIREQIDKKSNK